MGFLRTLGKWVKFILFCACMIFSAILSGVMIGDEKGIRILFCIGAIILALFSIFLYFIKLDRDNQLFAAIVAFLLTILLVYLAVTSEANLFGLSAAATGVGFALCCTSALLQKISKTIQGY